MSDWIRMLRAALPLAAALILASCGGGAEEDAPPRPTPLAQQAPAVSAVAPTEAARQLMDWAETNFPAFFPGHEIDRSAGPFTYRVYPGGTALGIVTGDTSGFPGFQAMGVYVAGGPFGAGLRLVAPLTQLITPSATASRCGSTPGITSIGPFQVAAGDCVLVYTVPQSQIDAMTDGRSMPFAQQLATDLRTYFATSFDIVFAVVPGLQAPYVAANFTSLGCSNFNNRQTCSPALGMVALTAANAFKSGPVLHEMLHGYVGTVQSSSRSIVPTTVTDHWGFAGVGGQLGGFDASTLVQQANGTWKAARPAYQGNSRPSQAATGFGEVANGGNSLPYANLELFLMGLIPREQLSPVTYPTSPVWVSQADGIFSAASMQTLSPDQLYSRLNATDVAWLAASPKAPRGVTVLITASGNADSATISTLNSDIDQFSAMTDPPVWNPAGSGPKLYNFWTATGGRAQLTMNRLSALRR